jgi:hypothetical protein
MISRIMSPLDLLSQPHKKARKKPGKKPETSERDSPPA